MTAERVQTRREQQRAATIQEIKDTARSLMRSCGFTDVVISEIAREMRMTAPAVYRYFNGRDELLTALIADAYHALGHAIEAARAEAPDVGGRFLATANAYRQWAVGESEQFGLIFGQPLPGYAAPEGGPTAEAANHAFTALLAPLVEAEESGILGPSAHAVGGALAGFFAAEGNHLELGVSPDVLARGCQIWVTLHGIVSLEAFGNITFLPQDARDHLFAVQVRALADEVGLPAPSAGWPDT